MIIFEYILLQGDFVSCNVHKSLLLSAAKDLVTLLVSSANVGSWY